MSRTEIRACLANLVWQTAPTGSWSWWSRQFKERKSLAEIAEDDANISLSDSHLFALELWARVRNLYYVRDIRSSEPLFGSQPGDLTELDRAKEFLAEARLFFDVESFMDLDQSRFNETTSVLFETFLLAKMIQLSLLHGSNELEEIDNEIAYRLFAMA